ncbi:UDP binding domain-containing protein [uncultured Nisaea sp.]|uniref:UDP binding domain-containing protein n=1 Tax=uncultured Nisaea sp. TaxID=538215 RepID=UPI0030EB7F8A|tara:strand:+ start:6598 stop:7890 length:1293 start_codon:yes stop_codon:yes gene_type:complete
MPNDVTKPVIGFAGMTHLGLNSAVAVADLGFEVIGFAETVEEADRLGREELPVVEPDLPEMLAANKERLNFSAQVSDLGRADIVYISVDVPTDDQGQSDLSRIRALLDRIIPALGPDALLVILCQVPPGFTRALDFPADRLFYQVETLVFGRAIERARYPERYIVGCADAALPLPEAYTALLGAFDCPILPMRYESAELAKISINCCLVASVSTANTLAELCERIGADWSEIVPALKLDRRIGQYSYLTPGLGLSGGNLERDLATVIRFAEANETDAGVVEAWVSNSTWRKDWPFRTYRDLIRPMLGDSPRLAILGLAYKENTHSLKNAPSLVLLENLGGDAGISTYDPVVKADVLPDLTHCKSALEACRDADVLFLTTPWPEFRELDVNVLAEAMRGRAVVDPYGLLDSDAARGAGFAHFVLGRSLGTD